MTDEDKKETAESADSGTERTRLSGHFELDFPKPKRETDDSRKKNKTFKSRLFNDLGKPRFYLEFAALTVVAIYTAFAGYQSCQLRDANNLTRKALEAATRPVVAVHGYNVDQRITFLENVGKLTAVANVRKKSVFGTVRLLSGPPLPSTQEQKVVAVGVGSAVKFPTSESLNQKGWFYMSGRITYGKGYFTRFCVEYTITPPNRSDEPCQDPKTNDSN